MSRLHVPARSRSLPRIAVLGMVGVAVASCSDSGRFGYTNTSSHQAPRQEVTGSIAPRSAPTSRVVAQPLPAPSAPATVSSGGYGYTSGNGSANGAQGLGAYRPSAPVAQAAPVYQQSAPTYAQPPYHQPTYAQPEITGSVAPRPVIAPPKPAGAWTWDGGSPVTVGYGDTAETIARKHGVPLAALMQTNGIRNVSDIKPGQRLVIPRYVSNGTPQAAAAPAHASNVNVHVVAPGETLMSISRRHGVTLSVLARANNIQPTTRISVGDRITIPGGRLAQASVPAAPIARAPQMAAPQPMAPAPHLAQPRTVPSEQVATIPAQNVRMATPEPEKVESPAKAAEPAGAMQSFRWPVKGRVIAGFGPKPSGGQNDGINLAVPEGTPVKAADDGVVAYAGNELKGYGNLVLIRHSNGFVSAYAHASELMVKRGDTIKRGQVIANAGQTGNVTSPQLHFEIRKGSTPVDPTKYLSGG
jgi:murein DD-endopeptidase MepM/ murein hydrolase activator NlpD